MSGMKLLLDGNRGVYIPQVFANTFDLERMKGVQTDDIETLREGPEAEDWDAWTEGYWDAWTNVLDNVTFEEDGNTWHLHQDGDLWAYCAELMSDEEYENFFGRERDVA